MYWDIKCAETVTDYFRFVHLTMNGPRYCEVRWTCGDRGVLWLGPILGT